MNREEFERIWKISEIQILGKEVIYEEFTEYDMARAELDRASRITIANRDIIIHGLLRSKKLILKILADFKQKKNLGVIPYRLATADNIVITAGVIRPEYFGLTTYRRTGLPIGRFHIIPTTAATAAVPGIFSIKENNICIITDIIELHPAANVTTFHFIDVDGVLPTRPIDTTASFRASNVQVHEMDLPIVVDVSLDWDGKLILAGDTEITPIGAWICLGKDIPTFT